MKEFQKKCAAIWRELVVLREEYAALLLTIVWSATSTIYAPDGESSAWFARSGAMMVLYALIIEFQLASLMLKNITGAVVVAGLGVPAAVPHEIMHKRLAITAHIFMITGTMIWAYGDVFYELMSSIYSVG